MLRIKLPHGRRGFPVKPSDRKKIAKYMKDEKLSCVDMRKLLGISHGQFYRAISYGLGVTRDAYRRIIKFVEVNIDAKAAEKRSVNDARV